MSTMSSLFEANPEELKAWLEQNRLNGFMDLPQDQRLYALEYVKTYDRYQAADAAGIARNQSMRILRDPLVQEFVKYLNEQKQHYSLIDAAFIEVQYLVLYGKLTGEEEVPMVDKDGMPFKACKFFASESVTALRDMAKAAGIYKDDPVGVNVTVNLNDVKVTDEQARLLDKVLDDNC